MNSIDKLLKIISQKKPLTIGLTVGILYFILYLWSIQHISIIDNNAASFSVLEDWSVKIFRMRVLFQWEPIAHLNFFGISIFFSMNSILGLILATLVFFNIGISVFNYSLRKVCSVKSGRSSVGLAGILPAMFTGFACCAPTFIIALAPVLASFTLFFIKIQAFLIPISILIMVVGLFWSLSKIQEEHIKLMVKE